MTITQLANYICTKMQKTDAQNVALCKMFLRSHWALTWNVRLWRQTLTDESMDVAAGTATVTIPATIDRVVALRFGTETTLTSENWEALLRDDPAAYDRHGKPWKFINAGRDESRQVLIRLVPVPEEDSTLLIIGKKPLPPCAEDTDSPSDYLDGVDQTLLALGEADMLEKQKEWNAGQLKVSQASAAVTTMENLQNDQSAQVSTMAPEPVIICGYDW